MFFLDTLASHISYTHTHPPLISMWGSACMPDYWFGVLQQQWIVVFSVCCAHVRQWFKTTKQDSHTHTQSEEVAYQDKKKYLFVPAVPFPLFTSIFQSPHIVFCLFVCFFASQILPYCFPPFSKFSTSLYRALFPSLSLSFATAPLPRL